MGDARLLFGKNGRQWLTNCSVLKTQLAQEGGELNINLDITCGLKKQAKSFKYSQELFFVFSFQLFISSRPKSEHIEDLCWNYNPSTDCL